MSQRYGIIEVSDRRMRMLSAGHIDILFNDENIVNIIRDEDSQSTHILMEIDEFPVVGITYGGVVNGETIYMLRVPHYAWEATPDGIVFTRKTEVTNG